MSDSARTSDMQVIKSGSQDPIAGPAECFTGKVQISTLFNAPAPARVGVAVVEFSKGARTNWHSHPLGQVLLVTEGQGWTQCEGGEKTVINPGDLIWCNCGKRHWHGATADSAMKHVAVQEALDGKPVDWFEAVSDEDYLA
ncbi:MAG: cupin domain-containing protein [Pseudoalteromonas sp.]|uniref:(R)-mandelonitrile lyase n=1 Tax=Pseudoalteromonas sp. TaxID=53249 RepID=UPI001D947ADD|nr:cupin domain-containing protein [Pseudoalteromonas sp.]NRA81246.1 cupin domain-containing protein [Pseudoalteromonas sp.]